MSDYSAKWRSPSNIALVKYWGKFKDQIPANPSMSFTLDRCHTDTRVRISEDPGATRINMRIRLDGEDVPTFQPKIEDFMRRLSEDVPWIKDFRFEIDTHNSFPHSSGIASSASGMSALALCLLDLQQQITGEKIDDFYRQASIWSRLGSGSASRSVYGGLVEWGRFRGIPESSDDYAVPCEVEVDPVFKDFCDFILLVEKGSKSISSSAGHKLMKEHPFAESRFLQAHENMENLLGYMKDGDLRSFGELVESEALTLHAMMMTSMPYYILMKPNTLAVMERIWHFRKDTGLPFYFTLDAGANIHMLFPQKYREDAADFIKNSVERFLQDEAYIKDQVGSGPQRV